MKFLLLLLFSLSFFSVKLIDNEQRGNVKLEKFLSNPLDLQRYKKERGFHCNSGGGSKESYHYKPKYAGIYYSYFLCVDTIPKTLRKPRGMDCNQLCYSQQYMMVYKKGKEVGEYMAKTDSLIQLRAQYPNKYLQKSDFVGKTLDSIKQEFGKPLFEKEHLKEFYTIYQSRNKTLLILIGDNKVSWFQIVRLNKVIKKFEDIPQDLLKYKTFG